ncbi:MAG: hypothetical protein RLY86_2853 [Pseudomonadota bacterium]|jgi:hypothetical protein
MQTSRRFRSPLHTVLAAGLALLVLAGGTVLTGPARAGDGFVPGLADVPLMPGLAVEGAADGTGDGAGNGAGHWAGHGAVVFDQPGGRIVEAVAFRRPSSGSQGPGPAGPVSQDGTAILRFYADTLPQLGWTAEAPGRFRRERERLEITVEPAPGGAGTKVRFLLKPLQ